MEDLVEVDLVPFLRVTEYDQNDNYGLTDAIMSSHIAIHDTGTIPVSLYYDVKENRGGLIKILEDEEGFNTWYQDGIMVSDSLGVGAVRNLYLTGEDNISYHKRLARNAFLAGNDILILHDFFSTEQTHIDALSADEASHENIKDVIEDFIARYHNDPRFATRIDEAVRKIVKSKFQQYDEDLSINNVTIDTSDVNQVVGQEENLREVDRIANEAIALIKPNNIDALPSPPTVDDRILFVIHDFEVPNCPSCSEEWDERTPEVLIKFLTEKRDFQRDNILWLNYYDDVEHEIEGTFSGLSRWLHGYYRNNDEISNEEIEDIRTELLKADWIIFIFITGDCGPDTNQLSNSNRCYRGYPEADTLKNFLEFISLSSINANIAAISFGAPPWSLDPSNIAQLDAYYAAFNQLESFQLHALSYLLQEATPSGASPIDALGTTYNLKDVLEPDPNQVFELEITSELTKTNFFVGDTLDIKISDLVDKNGNNLLYSPNVRWRYKNSTTNMEMLPLFGDNKLVNGEANASFLLNESGSVEIRAIIKNLESEPLTLKIFETPTSTPTTSPTPTMALIIPSKTPTPSSIVPPLETPTKENFFIPTPTNDVNDPPEPEPNYYLIFGGIFLLIIIIIVVIAYWIHNNDQSDPDDNGYGHDDNGEDEMPLNQEIRQESDPKGDGIMIQATPEAQAQAVAFLFEIGRWAASELKQRWSLRREKDSVTEAIDLSTDNKENEGNVSIIIRESIEQQSFNDVKLTMELIAMQKEEIIKARKAKVNNQKEYDLQQLTLNARDLRNEAEDEKISTYIVDIENSLKKLGIKIDREGEEES